MVTKFEQAMMKLAVVGHNPNTLIDCSEGIPTPAAVTLPSPTLPAGKSLADIQAACAATPFPALSAAPGEYLLPPSGVNPLTESGLFFRRL